MLSQRNHELLVETLFHLLELEIVELVG